MGTADHQAFWIVSVEVIQICLGLGFGSKWGGKKSKSHCPSLGLSLFFGKELSAMLKIHSPAWLSRAPSVRDVCILQTLPVAVGLSL